MFPHKYFHILISVIQLVFTIFLKSLQSGDFTWLFAILYHDSAYLSSYALMLFHIKASEIIVEPLKTVKIFLNCKIDLSLKSYMAIVSLASQKSNLSYIY